MPNPQPDLVGLTEIADRLGVKRETAYTWQYLGKLPEPEWLIGERSVWQWSTIKQWAIDTGRLSP